METWRARQAARPPLRPAPARGPHPLVVELPSGDDHVRHRERPNTRARKSQGLRGACSPKPWLSDAVQPLRLVAPRFALHRVLDDALGVLDLLLHVALEGVLLALGFQLTVSRGHADGLLHLPLRLVRPLTHG